jgi:hypothetical protein
MDTNDTPERDEQPTLPLDHAAQPAAAQPTEQLPTGQPAYPAQPTYAAPAPAAAPAQTSSSFLRRHAVGVGVAAAVLAVIVVAGGTAWGVSAAVASTQTAASAPMTSMNTSHDTKAAAHKKKHKVHGAAGTIATMSGDTWTLHADSGTTVTVKLSSSTAYGTKKTPATASSFAVGDKVGALGTRSGDTVTATRIVHLPLKAHTSTPSPAPTPGT